IIDSTPVEGGDVTFDATMDKGSTQNTSKDEMTKNGVTIYSTSAGLNYAEYRFYKGTTTISTNQGTITKIQFEGDDASYPLDNFTVNDDNGKYEATKTSGTWTGNAASISFSVSAQARVTKIIVTVKMGNDPVDADLSAYNEPVEVTYGKTFMVEESKVAAGPLTLTSGKEDIATVNGLVITPQAVGTTTITITSAANELYNEGTVTFTLTVLAPEAKDEAPKDENIITIFTDKNLNHNEDGLDWTASIDANSFETESPSRGVQFGAGKGKFTLTSNAQNVIQVILSMSTNDGSNTVAVNVGGNDFTTGDGVVTYTLPQSNDQTIIFEGAGSGTITISVNDVNRSVYFKSIEVKTHVDAPTVKLSTSGYASYCSAYPLDFSDADGFAAYYVSGVDGETVTFTKITGAIAGGVPFILYGTPEYVCELQYAEEAGETFESNMLVGTLAPTYVTKEENDVTNYGLSNGNFHKINDGVVPAHKAYLQVPNDVNTAALRIVFADGETTAIEAVESAAKNDGVYYNIAGQRVQTPTSGIYIVNGKKVLVK
ncbi:MAG: hypothetical protein J1F25_07985, partial [Prevotellaceae bacterium]|nr:hypothetical protein [Prevotellaceae bacterium]